MAKIIRFPLIINGNEIRTIEALRENFDLETILGYFTNGKLATWLRNQYYDEEAEAIEALSEDDPNLSTRINEIFGVKMDDADEINLDDLKRRNEKLILLRQLTSDNDILSHPELAASDQEELYEILDTSPDVIYLISGTFEIPISKSNITYIGINKPVIRLRKKIFDFNSRGLRFINVDFDGIDKAEDQFSLGECFEKGNGVEKSMEIARKWYEKAASNGYNKAKPKTKLTDKSGYEAEKLFLLGKRYHEGDGVETDLKKAFEYYKKSAELGHAYAQNRLANRYFNGEGTKKDIEKAYAWYLKSAENSCEFAYDNLVRCCEEFSYADKKKKFEAIKQAAESNGNKEIYYILGLCYDYTIGTLTDAKKAFEYYKKSAEMGLAVAQNTVGMKYLFGEGTEKDQEKAFMWFLKSAENNYLLAFDNLMYCCSSSKDEIKAFEVLKQAAESNEEQNLCNLMGECYSKGLGTPIDEKKAVEWYMKAAKMGDAESQYQIGLYYVDCLNYYLANTWFKRAAEQGHKEAQEYVTGERLEITTEKKSKVTDYTLKRLEIGKGNLFINGEKYPMTLALAEKIDLDNIGTVLLGGLDKKEVDFWINELRRYYNEISDDFENSKMTDEECFTLMLSLDPRKCDNSYNLKKSIGYGYDTFEVAKALAKILFGIAILENEIEEYNSQFN